MVMKTSSLKREKLITTLMVFGLFLGCGKITDPVTNPVPLKKHNSETVTVFFPSLVSDTRENDKDAAASTDRKISPTGVQEVVELKQPLSGKLLVEEIGGFHSVFQVEAKSYRSRNVFRAKVNEVSSAVSEYTIAGRLLFPVANDLAFFSTLSPYLSLVGQRAYFGQYKIGSADSIEDLLGETLDYEFRSVVLGADGELASDWQVDFSFEYDELIDFRSHDKRYHAMVSSLAFGRNYSVLGQGTLELYASAEYALTKTYQSVVFGDHDDAKGDNLRTALTLSLIQPLDSLGRFYITPNASIIRTAYTKSTPMGKIDYLMHAEIAAICRILPWMHIRVFTNYQDKTANEQVKRQLPDHAEYNNWDAGLGLGVSFSF